MAQKPVIKGLEGIIVDESAISLVEGKAGRLSYRGYDIGDLVKHKSFYDVVWLVVFGAFPTEKERSELVHFLHRHQNLEDYELGLLQNLPAGIHPMEMLQCMLPVIDRSVKAELSLPEGSREAVEGLVLAAKVSVLPAALRCIRLGRELPAALAEPDFHANFLHMFTGRAPEKRQVETLDVTQILQMEHSFNASTFAARVTASTLAPVHSALSSAVGALYGRLHGGADEAAVRMAEAIGSPENAARAVTELLNAKKKIMGMGHREYKTLDPRARILKPMAAELCAGTGHETLYKTLEAVEAAVHDTMALRKRDVRANVEFYKGAVFRAVGIPPEYFTAMFAMARVFGYLAHILESRHENRIIRPQSRYTGPTPRSLSASGR